jgi:hypothetical protein
MKSFIFTFARPYLDWIDSGHLFRKPFAWLYTLYAVIFILIPIFSLIGAIAGSIFDMPAKTIVGFLLIWLVICLASWICFQIWWDRRQKVLGTSSEGDDFVATPVFSHYIQTLGETIGTWIAIVGFFGSLVSAILLGSDAQYIAYKLGLNFGGFGLASMIISPIIGFLIIVFTRFLAEQARALSSIANNTSKTN